MPARTILHIVLLCTLVAHGCNSHKQAIDSKLPYWTKGIISTPGYYSGIGYSEKEKSSDSHYATAKKEALKDLASEISTNISSNTVLISISDDENTREELSSIIHESTSASIEGYEKVDYYENKNGYWVYYQLSKDVYAQNQLEKKQEAETVAIRKFKLAHSAETNRDLKLAIQSYSECLESIKMHSSEAIYTTIENSTYDIISESQTRVNYILNNIELDIPINEIICMQGSTVSNKQAHCIVSYQGAKIKNVPIKISYSGNLKSTTSLSNNDGIASANIDIESKKNEETITFSIDKNEILKQSSIDYAIRKWILNTPTQEKVIKITINKPKIFVSTETKLLKAKIESDFINKQFPVVDNKKDADYIIIINIAQSTNRNNNGIYTVQLEGDLSIQQAPDKNIYNKRISPVKGMHLNQYNASKNAQDFLIKQIDTHLFKDMQNTILKSK